MRKSFNGLFAAASQQLNDGRLGTDMLFVFVNKENDRIRPFAKKICRKDRVKLFRG